MLIIKAYMYADLLIRVILESKYQCETFWF